MKIFDESELASSLAHFPKWKQVAFMVQTAARMLPNYECFSAETGFGNVFILRKALNIAIKWINNDEIPDDIFEIRQDCARQAPQTERFRSSYTSAALDAANCLEIILDAIINPTDMHPIEVASLARDTIDLFVQEILNLDPGAADFEESILRHDLMQRELCNQSKDLELLRNISNNRSELDDVALLRVTSGSLSG